MVQMAVEPEPHETKRINLELVDKPARRNPWRPTTLTVRAFLKICHNIERGFSIPNACEVEAISYRNFRHRVSRSPRLEKRLKEAEAVRFELRHEQAIVTIMAAGEKSWPAHAWWAERNLPERYALKTVHRADSENGEQLIGDRIPAERVANYGTLMLEVAEENKARPPGTPLESTELPGSDSALSA
jgi:hypothetical protein